MGRVYLGTYTPYVPAPPPEIQNGAEDAVLEVLADTGVLAATAQTQALAAIEALGAFALDVDPVTVPDIPLTTVGALALGDQPAEPDGLTPTYPLQPGEPTIDTLTDIELGDEPVFDVATPLLIDVALPDPLSMAMPSPPSLTEVAIPVDPDYVLPDVPTLIGLNLPDVPVLDLPLFTDTLDDKPAAPASNFSWGEVEYDTALLTLANSRLLDLIAGPATGLSPANEAGLWNRGRDRQALLTQRSVEEAQRLVAARGFSMPTGVLVRLVQQAIQEGIRLDGDLSRDILIKQAELEQSNFQFSFNLAVQLEGRLIEHFNTVQSRALDATKFTHQALIDIFNARVSLYQADVQAFAVKAQVFKTRLEAALAQLEIYKAQLEGQKLVGEINQQQVAIYTARLEGVRVVVDVFRSQIESVKARIEAEGNRVNVFRAQIEGYDSAVKAKTAEYEGYGHQVKAEVAKVQMYGEQVGAFKARTDAYAALVNARLGAATLDFKQTQEFPMELYKTRVQAYQVGVQAEAERLKSLASVFSSRVQAFAEGERAKAAHTGAEVEAVKATSAVYVSQAGLALQAGEINLRLAMSAAETAQTSLRAAGQLSGQLAAAAMAARNVSASISSSANNSTSNSASNTASVNSSDSNAYSEIHTYRHETD